MNRKENVVKAVMEVMAEKEHKAGLKCFNCGKTGHFQRNCPAPRKRTRSLSPQRANKRAPQIQTQESPLN